jgi:hypothetical protein
MSILPHDALAVDVYPDEAPETPLSAYHEPEAHAETCTCGACEHAFYDRLQVESSAEYDRLTVEYPLDPEDGPEDWGPAEGWPPSVEWDGWFTTPTPNAPERILARPMATFADEVEAEARWYRTHATTLGTFLHGELMALAGLIRRTQARTPQEFEARREIEEHDLMADFQARGWNDGFAAGLAATL